LNEDAVKKDRKISCQKGFTLFEILLAVIILGIAIAPMVKAFSTAISAASIQEEITVFTYQAEGTLNRIADLDYDTLSANAGSPIDLASLFGSTAEANKETFTFRGQSYSPVAAITDAGGGDGGLLEITVTAGDRTLKTLRSEY